MALGSFIGLRVLVRRAAVHSRNAIVSLDLGRLLICCNEATMRIEGK